MTRAEFINRLKDGLVGLPTTTANDILADYQTHFDDGLAAGRTEAEVAAALGDPVRLARELKAEAGIQRWRQEKNPSAAAGAVFAVLGLGALDILILLPLLMGVVGTVFGFFIAAVVMFVCGGVVMVAGPFAGFPGGPFAAILMGLGLMAGAVFIAALLTIFTIWLVNGVVWFARLHYRLLKPALEPSSSSQSTSPSGVSA
ncbi:DUF1700 domain-containing protein [Brevundimonas sp. SORGH_AS_0993]|uniref:DUF1700 domain-containing protein n=1 Tax=Brevundimonas sp. SORGH_AS_0993 TaxID=3041794 RepID=UPI0027859F87|nr:DUF1700 domain-containing protein [Brevundimonas sp. SORGH_AS_0993]MDQ1154325.1 putative membrane protein [Brevundimonas sp. SORGH_AS_0993]